MNTLLLAQNSWDLTVDVLGNIAMATDPYAIAQDVASACRLFLGELWYDTSQGIPYFQQILGKLPPGQFIKEQFIAVAMTVPEVQSVQVFFTGFKARTLSGQIQVTTTNGVLLIISAQDFLTNAPWFISAASPQASASPVGGP